MIKTFQQIGVQKYILPHLISPPGLGNNLAVPLSSLISSVMPVSQTQSYHTQQQPQHQTHQFQQMPMLKPATFSYDLAGGMPPPVVLDAALRSIKSSNENLGKHRKVVELLDYGQNPGPAHTLEQLSLFLSRRYRTGVPEDSIFTVAGASQALSFLPHILGPDRGGRAFVEQPTYMHTIDIFTKDNHYDISPVESDGDGIIPEAFEKAARECITPEMLAEAEANGRFASILYLQTAFANPGGWSLPRQRLIELDKIAAKWNVLILADDVYSFTNFVEVGDDTLEKMPYLPSTATSSGELSNNVVTLGSLSKLVAPGLRFGWVIASKRIIDAIDNSGFFLSGGCSNQYIAQLAGEMISDGTVDVLTDQVRQELKARFNIAQSIFSAHLPGNVKYTKAHGGFFIWIEVPKSLMAGDSSASLVNLLEERYAVRVVDGAKCFLSKVTNQRSHWAVRITLTCMSLEDLPAALRSLSDGICDYLGFKPSV